MNTAWTRRGLLRAGGVGFGAGILLSRGTLRTRAASGGWPQYGYDEANTGYNPEAGGPGRDPEIAWTYEPEAGGAIESPAVVGERVYCSAGNTLVCLDATDGTELWTHERGQQMSTPAVGDELVYVTASDGAVIGVDRQSGDRQWERLLRGWAGFPPTLAGDSLYVADAERICRIRRDTGDIEWSVELEHGPNGATAVTDHSVWTPGTYLTQVSLVEQFEEDGRNPPEEQAWDVVGPTEDEEEFALAFIETRWLVQQTPTAVDSTVYLPSRGLQALDENTGDVNWIFDENVMIPGSPTVVEETLYVGSGDDVADIQSADGAAENAGTVYALDRTSGEVNWTIDVDGPVNAPIAATENYLYVTTGAGTVTALDRLRGSEVWSIDAGEEVSAPAVAGDSLYVGTEEGTLLAIREPEPESIDFSSPTPAPEETPTPTPESDANDGGTATPSESGSEDSDDGSGPGFGLVSALGGLGGIAYLARRYGDDE